MTDKTSLEQKVLDELQKTGYPTEIISASVMQRRNWGIIHNPSYLDDSEGRSREFDIRAYQQRVFTLSDKKYSVGMFLITECKKSEKPWVFFTTLEKHNYSRLGKFIKWSMASRQVFSSDYSSNAMILDDELRKFHHYFQQKHVARTFHEPFKGQEKSSHTSMIYSAVMSSIKATLFHLNEVSSQSALIVYYPLIVFSGDLFEARVGSAKDIKLFPVNYIQLSFNYITRHESRQSDWAREIPHNFIVDIVQENYLEKFLEVIEFEHELLASHLEKALTEF